MKNPKLNILLMTVLTATCQSLFAQSTVTADVTEVIVSGQVIEEDVTLKTEAAIIGNDRQINQINSGSIKSSNNRVEEYFSGGRLKRVTILKDNGIEEVYENDRKNPIWSSSESELGDTPNVRRWVLGRW